MKCGIEIFNLFILVLLNDISILILFCPLITNANYSLQRVIPLPLSSGPGLKPISHQGAAWTEWSSLMALISLCHQTCPPPSLGPAQPPSQLCRNPAIPLSAGE